MSNNNDGKVIINIDSNTAKVAREFENLLEHFIIPRQKRN